MEKVLLSGVVERYGREIHLRLLGKLEQIRKSDIDLLDRQMTRYSAWEHSQPAEAQICIPMWNEVKPDIEEVQLWVKEFDKLCGR